MADRNRGSRSRPYYPPPPQRRPHSAFGYWVPIVVTGTIAIGALAAWIWSERHENDEDEDEHGHDAPPESKPQRPPGTAAPPYSGPIPSQAGGPQGAPPPAPGGEAASYYSGSRSQQQRYPEEHREEDEQTFFGQVRGALRRTPSPQQFLHQASRQISAGVAAAGSALGSIMEDGENGGHVSRSRGQGRRHGEGRGGLEREGFSDHERWSEEAEEQTRRVDMVGPESGRRVDAARDGRGENEKGRARKSVAVVVSADTNMDGKMDDADITSTEHASILSHLPHHHNPEQTDLTILIYAPGLTQLPPLNYRPSTADADTASNLGSSYSNINTPAATPRNETQSISPNPQAADNQNFPSPGRQFDHLYLQALTLVDHPSKILSFTTVDGYLSILRHLAPQLAYISDLLAGQEGRTVDQLKGWVGHTVLVVGDDGTGGLADTETEDDEGGVKREERRWYDESSLVGLGKAIEVVDASRVGDDWLKRVCGRE